MLTELRNVLDKLICDDLRKECRKLGLKTNGNSFDLKDRILQFYSDSNFVKNTFKELNPYEKEYLETYVKQNYNPFKESLELIDQKYENSEYQLIKSEYFFIHNSIPDCFRVELNKLIEPYEISFTKTTINVEETKNYNEVSISENINYYLDEFIKYINEKKIKITSKKRLLPKKNCMEFINRVGIKEVNKDFYEPEFKDIEKSVIVNGIFNLLLTSEVINNQEDYFSLGSNYKEFIKLNKYDKVRYLLNNYLISLSINEIEEITIAKYSYVIATLHKPREFILETIKKLPINEWIEGPNFFKEIRKKDGDFLRKEMAYDPLKKFSDTSEYYYCSYFELEYPFVETCLINYFAVLGIIDCKFNIHFDNWSQRGGFFNSFIKLTDFGAQILKLTKQEETEEGQSKLIIQKNQIIIENSPKSLEHQLFFERFLPSIKNDKEIIYTLDFKGIANAIDLGIELDEILNYLVDNSYKIPKAIVEEFSYYKKVLGKIHIKTVTVLEYPKEMQGLIYNKISKYDSSQKGNNYVIIDPKKAKEIKRNLENERLFCNIDE